MSDVRIFHNPSCSKSRGALEILSERGVDAEVVRYLDTPPDRTTLEEILPGAISEEPSERVIASEELQALVACLSSVLSELESRVLSLYLDGHSYEQIGERLECDTKTVDNALQRVKRKVAAHIAGREVLV